MRYIKNPALHLRCGVYLFMACPFVRVGWKLTECRHVEKDINFLTGILKTFFILFSLSFPPTGTTATVEFLLG